MSLGFKSWIFRIVIFLHKINFWFVKGGLIAMTWPMTLTSWLVPCKECTMIYWKSTWIPGSTKWVVELPPLTSLYLYYLHHSILWSNMPTALWVLLLIDYIYLLIEPLFLWCQCSLLLLLLLLLDGGASTNNVNAFLNFLFYYVSSCLAVVYLSRLVSIGTSKFIPPK